MIGALAVLVSGIASAQGTFPENCDTASNNDPMSAISKAIIDLVNEERSEAGRTPLECEAGLTRAAQKHSTWMAEKRKLSHTGKNGSDFFERIRDEHPGFFGSGAENIYMRHIGSRETDAQKDAEAIVSGWMASPGHRRNILSADKSHIGVSVARGGDRLYATQVFAQAQ